jgi:hypothetical protein
MQLMYSMGISYKGMINKILFIMELLTCSAASCKMRLPDFGTVPR